MPELKRFFVMVPEVHYSRMRIMANSASEARQLVSDGDGYCYDTEYSHTIDDDIPSWKVLDENMNPVVEKDVP